MQNRDRPSGTLGGQSQSKAGALPPGGPPGPSSLPGPQGPGRPPSLCCCWQPVLADTSSSGLSIARPDSSQKDFSQTRKALLAKLNKPKQIMFLRQLETFDLSVSDCTRRPCRRRRHHQALLSLRSALFFLYASVILRLHRPLYLYCPSPSLRAEILSVVGAAAPLAPTWAGRDRASRLPGPPVRAAVAVSLPRASLCLLRGARV